MLLKTLILVLVGTLGAQAQDVHIRVTKEGQGNGARYIYSVENRTSYPITTLMLGNHRKPMSEDCPDLDYEAQASFPDGWEAVVKYKCEEKYYYYFSISDQETPGNFERRRIDPGATLGGFVLTRTEEEYGTPVVAPDKFTDCRFTVGVIAAPGGAEPPNDGWIYGRVELVTAQLAKAVGKSSRPPARKKPGISRQNPN